MAAEPTAEEGSFQKVISPSGNDPAAHVMFLNGNPVYLAQPLTVVRAVTSTGARVLAPVKQEMSCDPQPFDGSKVLIKVKEESVEGFEPQVSVKVEMGSDGSQASPMETAVAGSEGVSVKGGEMGSDSSHPMEESACSVKPSPEGKVSLDDFLKATNTKVASDDEYLKSLVKQEPPAQMRQELSSEGTVREEADAGSKKLESLPQVDKVSVKKEAVTSDCNDVEVLKVNPFPGSQRPTKVKKQRVEEKILNLEDGDFPEDPGWILVGRKVEVALSTTKGRKLVDNEIVHFNFPLPTSSYKSQWIVRITTKRSGEVGRLPMEWAKNIIPLVQSSKVKVRGRCIAAPYSLQMMQEIMLLVSFYIHHSIFTACGDTSWKLEACGNIDSTIYPLLTLFRMLEIKPYQKADFTPEELDSRKRLLNLKGDSDEAASVLPVIKRRKGCEQYPEKNDDEQAVSEASLNKLVGAAEIYDLEEMEAPDTLMCNLKPYQKQALYWMSEMEKGIDVENAEKTLHPCWASYQICDGREIYVNIFTGQATTKFPKATQMTRGGILADAMGLGKTVMTIALILSNLGKGNSENKDVESANGTGAKKKRNNTNTSFRAKGGTLIVCPMALLGQWKDELETHSEADSISIFVHYGGGRTNSAEVILEYDVVLTTYGVLTSAYQTGGENSIYHRVDWYRVVLDEAHTIKAYRTQAAQAAFALSSHCRWCLTGTPLQNSMEDLFSLLCFLRVEPWGNWAWWNKLIQRPYENGDPRALKLVKAILRTLMLRRTKETKDKEGRPILVLPPTDVRVIECEQSETENDFYNALFMRSKVQFDQYVAQGKVLHNYLNILELLLRLRQCCNHPFLVMSRSDSQQFADLNKLARRFLQSNSDSPHACSQSDPQKYAELNKLASRFLLNPDSSSHTNQSRAYIEEVLEHIQKGEIIECPICMESADDPVFTSCAHRICRECLFNSWKTPMGGPCPICRHMLNRNDLITCPSESPFRVDVENNLTESSKVSKLLDFLERIQMSHTGEKSIVFSQWTSFFDLLGSPLRRRGIGYLRFDGKLSQKQREKILHEFNETREKRVLLISLKAGGVGLNLTAASNVFIMDPWWNPAVEEQAIMRIHRIGQKRKVIVRRFIVKGTVEERLQQVQAKKQRMISGALTDDEVRSARIADLKMLFT